MKYFLFVLSVVLSQISYADEIYVAAAADLKYAIDELVADFYKLNQGDKIEIITGSSGKFYHQITNGAPFHMFFSADIEYPNKLFQEKQTLSEPKMYAIGRLVLWSENKEQELNLDTLKRANFKKIAIANPLHAPYGKRAKECLEKLQLFDKFKDKLIYTENVAQVFQYVHSGTVEIGIGALSLALAPSSQKEGKYFLIDESCHSPLEQGYVTLKYAENNLLATKFDQYLQTEPARKIFEKYGFKLPSK